MTQSNIISYHRYTVLDCVADDEEEMCWWHVWDVGDDFDDFDDSFKPPILPIWESQIEIGYLLT